MYLLRGTGHWFAFALALGAIPLAVFAERPEVHDQLLMDAKEAVNPAGKEHRKVHVGAEGAIAHQQIADAQQR